MSRWPTAVTTGTTQPGSDFLTSYGGGIGRRLGDRVRVVLDLERIQRTSDRDATREYTNQRIAASLTWGASNRSSTALLLLLLMWGQAPPAIREAGPPAQAQLASDDYVVGPQDVLNLTVFNDDTLSRPALVVDSDGTIDCPYVGRQKVNGMTTRQIEEMLRRLLGLRRRAGQCRWRLPDEPEHQRHGQGFPQPAREHHGRGQDAGLRRTEGRSDADARAVAGWLPHT